MIEIDAASIEDARKVADDYTQWVAYMTDKMYLYENTDDEGYPGLNWVELYPDVEYEVE